METSARLRGLPRGVRVAVRGLAVSVALLGLAYLLRVGQYADLALFDEQYLALILGLALTLLFLVVPSRSDGAWRWLDYTLAASSLLVSMYTAVHYPRLSMRMGLLEAEVVLLSLAAIVLLLEAVRRLFGKPLLLPLAAFVVYARFGAAAPGFLRIPRDIPWDRLSVQIFLGSEGVFGVALRTVVLVVLIYVMFAKFFLELGGGELLFAAAQRLIGRYRGGPAKVQVLASAFFGMFSGSPVANVVGTGSFTIPVAKRVGYSSEFAAAVEAVASTGGLFTPPVMGAAAFIMADFLGMPYGRVALAAIVPAALYYLCVFLQVDLRAGRLGLRGLTDPVAVPWSRMLREGWIFVVAFGVLVYGLMRLFVRPEDAALAALVALVICGLLQAGSRRKLARVVQILEGLSTDVLDVIVVAAAAGIVVGVVSYTGLGIALSRTLVQLAEGSVWALLLTAAVTSVILGMGLPITACYILLAVLAAPALVQAGIEPLAAHLFILYFAALSFITPPVCTAVYAAASIGKGSQAATALEAVKLGAVGFLVPFAFAMSPDLVTFERPGYALLLAITLAGGATALAAGLEGFAMGHLGMAARLALVAAGAATLAHPTLWVKAACLALVGAGLTVSRRAAWLRRIIRAEGG